jgi:hypothetical protein
VRRTKAYSNQKERFIYISQYIIYLKESLTIECDVVQNPRMINHNHALSFDSLKRKKAVDTFGAFTDLATKKTILL